MFPGFGSGSSRLRIGDVWVRQESDPDANPKPETRNPKPHEGLRAVGSLTEPNVAMSWRVVGQWGLGVRI